MIFPETNLDEIIENINTNENTENLKTFGKIIMLDFSGNSVKVILENGKPKFAETTRDKVQMFIQMLLRTKLESAEIYKNTGFGMTYFEFKGKKLPSGFVDSELKREIKSNLEKLSCFEKIDNFKSYVSNTQLNISFDVILKDSEDLKIEEVLT